MDEVRSMDLSVIQKLVRIMTRAKLAELEIEDAASGLRVHLRRASAEQTGAPLVSVMHAGVAGAPAPQSAPALEAQKPALAPPASGAKPFLSPMVGTFFRASSPDAEPFVEVGKGVSDDTVIAIIEAMKVMNEIKAEMRGVIAEILVGNGEPVEYGQPLFLIRPS